MHPPPSPPLSWAIKSFHHNKAPKKGEGRGGGGRFYFSHDWPCTLLQKAIAGREGGGRRGSFNIWTLAINGPIPDAHTVRPSVKKQFATRWSTDEGKRAERTFLCTGHEWQKDRHLRRKEKGAGREIFYSARFVFFDASSHRRK